MVSTLGFRVVVSVSNFLLDLENYGRERIPGHGHMHYYIDGSLAGTSWTETFAVGPIRPGNHTLVIALRNNDHTPLDPDVSRRISVTAVPPAIDVVVSAHSVQEGEPLVISWSVTGFVLDGAAIGGDPEGGRGHVHLGIDGVFREASAAASVTITDLAQGNHTIRVSLHDNDHSPLSPEVYKTAFVEVREGVPTQSASFNPAPEILASIVGAVVGGVAIALWRYRKRKLN